MISEERLQLTAFENAIVASATVTLLGAAWKLKLASDLRTDGRTGERNYGSRA
jgi:hypothetical protein